VSQLALGGILPALVTPLTADGAVDVPGCRRLVDHVLRGGVHGVLTLGSSGEVTALEAAQRQLVLETIIEAVNGRLPVLAGVAQTSLTATVSEVARAAAAGANAVLLAPPYYAPIDAATTLSFYQRVADAAALPILVYNIPSFTKVRVAPDDVARLAEAGAVVGIKDSSRDFEYFLQVLDVTSNVPGFQAFTGSDSLLLAALLAGGAGAITLGANIAPAWLVQVCINSESRSRTAYVSMPSPAPTLSAASRVQPSANTESRDSSVRSGSERRP